MMIILSAPPFNAQPIGATKGMKDKIVAAVETFSASACIDYAISAWVSLQLGSVLVKAISPPLPKKKPGCLNWEDPLLFANCKTLPSNLPGADCSIFALSVGRRRHVLLPLILPP